MAYIPPKPKSDKEFLSVLSWIIFISGFNYRLVEERWPKIKRAFHSFDIKKLAGGKAEDYLDKPGMIRNKGKIQAILDNATICKELAKEHGSVMAWVRSVERRHKKEPLFNPSTQEAMQRFRRIGKTTSRWIAYVCTRDESLLQGAEAERRRRTITR